MTSVTMGASPRLDIGKVIEQTFAVLKRNLIPFGLAAAILVGVPVLLEAFVQYGYVKTLPTGMLTPAALGQASGGRNALSSIIGLVNGFTALLLQAAIIYGVVRDDDGRRANLKDCLTVALKNCLPLLGLGIVMGLGLVIGFILLVVPGVILALAWSVAAPVKVMEGLGVMGALRRSRDLTRGRRWGIFLLGLIVAVIGIVVELVAAGVSGGFIAGMSNPLRLFLLAPLLAIAWALLTSVGVSVLYIQLREGVTAETLATVFD